MADFASALWNKPTSGDTGEGGGASDPVTRSLRLVGPASSSSSTASETCNLKRTFSSAGNRKTYTVAFWVKRSSISNSNQILFAAGSSGDSNTNQISFRDNDTLEFYLYPTTSMSRLATAARFRDVSAWYHVTVAVDTTQATAANRVKMFVNGVQQTFETHTTYPDQNDESHFNDNKQHKFGEEQHRNRYNAEVLLADCYFIDGSAIEPVDNFIETTGYGSYKPKAFDMSSYSGNSFHIDAQPAHDADLLVSSVGRNDGDTTFVDVAQGHGLTVSGNTEHSIKVGNPFTGDDRAIKFTGSNSDNLQTDASSDLTFGTGDFYIQTWVNPSTVSTQWQALIADDHYGSLSGFAFYMGYDNLYCYRYGSAIHSVSDVFTVGKWTHVAWSRSGGTSKVYVDGVEMASASNSYDFTSDRLWIGRQNHSSLYAFNGYLYDVEIRVGAGGDGSKPTSKVSAGANTELLIQPDKDNAIHDETGNRTITTNGTVTRTASTPYDAAAKSTAMYFDGSGDYLQTPSDSIFAIGTSETFTAECWVYFNSNPSSSSYMGILSAYNSGSALNWIIENAGGYWGMFDSGSGQRQTSSTAVTTGEWHHVALVKTDGSTDGARLYLNGNKIDDVTVNSNATAARKLTIGGIYASTSYNLNGYIFDARYAKGETKYSGSTYDTPTAPLELTPVYIGGDQSGNKNHFTPTGISSHDVMLDTPTKNYATLNPVSDVVASGSNTFSEGNLTADLSNAYNKAASTIAVSSGKWYAEVRFDDNGYQMVGIGRVDCLENTSTYIGGSGAFGYMLYKVNGDVYHNGSGTSIWGALSAGDVIQIALDLDNNKVWWGKNGTWNGTVGSSGETSISAGEYYFAQSYRDTCTWNFGQDNTFAGQFTGTPDNAEFAYEIPSGFQSLNSSNLDAPAVTPTNHFDVLTYNGAYDNYSNYSGTSPQTITGTDFTPEIVWIKDRDNVSSNYGNGYHGGYWFDNVMGTGYALNTDLDNSSHYGNTLASGEDGISSFNSDGFTVDEADETNAAADSSYGGSIDTYERYVAWCWKLGKSGSSSTWASGNTDPDTEKYNDSAGVSIIDYYDSEYGGSAITLNHSLGAAPEFAIAFDYEGYTSGHYVWHKDLSSGNYLTLDSSSSQSSDTDYFPASPATATTFTLGTSISSGTQSHVALFTSVEGYSKFGTYKGAGSSGVFVYTGHRPKMVWLKNIDASGSWMMFDAVRDTYNETVNYLQANSSASETTNSGYKIDILSNGFRINVESTAMNNSAYDYVFCSWAEQPFAAPSNAK